MRYIVTAIEYANDRAAKFGLGKAGPGCEVGLVLRRIPDNATQIHKSNIPDPKEEQCQTLNAKR